MSDDRDPLRELGKQLPWDRPDAARRDAVRSSLLIAAGEGAAPARRRRWVAVGAAFAAGAFAAASAVLVLAPDRREPSRPAGTAHLTASSGARLEHGMVATRTGVDEIVRVRDGSVRLAIDQVRAGDHVRVQTGDAEIEGSGEYEVRVADDAIAAVAVRSGSAEVRVRGQQPIFLAAGQSWRASIVTAELPIVAPQPPAPQPPAPQPSIPQPAAPVPPIPPLPPDRIAQAPAPAPSAQAPAPAPSAPAPPALAVRIPDGQAPASERERPEHPTDAQLSAAGTPGAGSAPAAPKTRETERRFQAGWALLRGGKPREAAVELAAAAEADERDPLAADARYFQAMALVRAGEGREAERVLVRFLDRAPRSLRRGRASVLLAQLIADRGDLASARAWFRSAADDPDPAVAAAARAGLAKLDAPY